MKLLCAVEAMNLSNLFGDCHDLSATRGGGLAVLKFAQEIAKSLHVAPVFTGASQGLFVLEASSPEEAEALIEAELAKVDFLEHVVISVATEEEDTFDFVAQRARLKARQRWDQMQRPSVVYPRLEELDVCKTDRVRPAHRTAQLPNESSFTRQRRELGREKKHSLVQELLKEAVPADFGVVNDLTELSKDATRGNLNEKIALIRMDGNGFGNVAQACENKEALRRFSEEVRLQQEGFIRHLVATNPDVGWWTQERKLRLEIVIYGGDEVMLIVPAWAGWKALRCFYDVLPSGRTYSGGIVFCHHNSPIHAIKDLSSDLADIAKKSKPKDNKVACQVLETFDSIGEDAADYFKRRYAFAPASKPDAHLWTLDSIVLVDENMSLWRATMAKRKLHKAVALLLEQGTIKRKELEEEVAGLFESLGDSRAPGRVALQKLVDTHGDAAFVHVLDLWDYVAPEPPSQQPTVGAGR